MKVGFHFHAMHNLIANTAYGQVCEEAIFRVLLRHKNLNISSKIFVGDLLLMMQAQRIKDAPELQGFEAKFQALVTDWLNPVYPVWSKVIVERFKVAFISEIFVVVFETISLDLADYIHTELQVLPYYVGAIQVDDSTHTHWVLYSNQLSPEFRLVNRSLYLFWEGQEEDDKDVSMLEELKKLPFEKVDFESLNGRYTIFDEFDNFEQGRRVADWKYRTGDLLAFMAESVVDRLTDAAPDVGNRLWAILDTFERSETNEQYSQVAASCRRIVEYVSDQLLPPTDDLHEGRKLGTKQYRNRLLAFADRNRQSDTNIDLILVSTKTLSEQIEKLTDLANKGTHAEVYRAEARRCLLRTVLLLDDIISLRKGAFEIKPRLNAESFLGEIFGSDENSS